MSCLISMSNVVLITGASGYIGGAIAERLIDRAELRSLTSHLAKDRSGGGPEPGAHRAQPRVDRPRRIEGGRPVARRRRADRR